MELMHYDGYSAITTPGSQCLGWEKCALIKALHVTEQSLVTHGQRLTPDQVMEGPRGVTTDSNNNIYIRCAAATDGFKTLEDEPLYCGLMYIKKWRNIEPTNQ